MIQILVLSCGLFLLMNIENVLIQPKPVKIKQIDPAIISVNRELT